MTPSPGKDPGVGASTGPGAQWESCAVPPKSGAGANPGQLGADVPKAPVLGSLSRRRKKHSTRKPYSAAAQSLLHHCPLPFPKGTSACLGTSLQPRHPQPRATTNTALLRVKTRNNESCAEGSPPSRLFCLHKTSPRGAGSFLRREGP